MLDRIQPLFDSTFPLGKLQAASYQIHIGLTDRSMQAADGIHAWLVRQLPEGHHPAFVRPFNYMKAVSLVTLILGAGTLFVVASPYMLPIIQNRNIWAAASLIAVLMFTSGHMFNHIRKVPYVANDGKGGVSYFAGGFQNQYGLETQIVAALCRSICSVISFATCANQWTDGVLAFAAISLALKVPRIADPKAQGAAVLAWGGGLFLVYSFLLSIFRFKNGGYPFFLPPF
jgi:oligosaccharyltransferase complex subunit gamma